MTLTPLLSFSKWSSPSEEKKKRNWKWPPVKGAGTENEIACERAYHIPWPSVCPPPSMAYAYCKMEGWWQLEDNWWDSCALMPPQPSPSCLTLHVAKLQAPRFSSCLPPLSWKTTTIQGQLHKALWPLSSQRAWGGAGGGGSMLCGALSRVGLGQ